MDLDGSKDATHQPSHVTSYIRNSSGNYAVTIHGLHKTGSSHNSSMNIDANNDVTNQPVFTTTDFSDSRFGWGVDKLNQTTTNSSPNTSSTFDGDFEALNRAMAFTLLPTIIYISLLMVVGLAGNSVVLLVYWRRFKPSATRTYILSMTVFDLLANSLSLPGEILDIRYPFTFNLPWLCKAFRSVNSFLTLVSAFVLVAVARERYIKIIHPLSKERSFRRIRFYVFLCGLASFVLTVPFAVLNGAKTVPVPGFNNVTGMTCSVDDSFEETIFPLIYSAVMALTFLGCVVTMAASYICIARALWRHKHKLQLATINSGPVIHTNTVSSGMTSQMTTSSIMNDVSSGPISEQDVELPSKPLSNGERKYEEDGVVILSVQNVHYKGPDNLRKMHDGCQFNGSTDRNPIITVSSFDVAEMESDSVPEISYEHQSTTSINRNETKSNITEGQSTSSISRKADDNEDTSPVKQEMNKGDNTKLLLTPETLRKPTKKPSGKPKSPKPDPFTKQGKVKDKAPRHLGKKIPSSTTFMMFVLTATFVINYLPHLCIISLRAVRGDLSQGLTGAMLNVYNIALRSYFLNCAVNSLVYGACNPRFRQECRNLFRRRRR